MLSGEGTSKHWLHLDLRPSNGPLSDGVPISGVMTNVTSGWHRAGYCVRESGVSLGVGPSRLSKWFWVLSLLCARPLEQSGHPEKGQVQEQGLPLGAMTSSMSASPVRTCCITMCPGSLSSPHVGSLELISTAADHSNAAIRKMVSSDCCREAKTMQGEGGGGPYKQVPSPLIPGGPHQ